MLYSRKSKFYFIIPVGILFDFLIIALYMYSTISSETLVLVSTSVGLILLFLLYFHSYFIEKRIFLFEKKEISDEKLRDLEEQRQIGKLLIEEKRLKESEARFKQIAKSTKSIIWEVDTNFNFIYLSSTLPQVLGYNEEDLLGKPIFENFYYTEEVDGIRRSIIKSGEFYNIETQFCKKDGEIIWLQTSGYAVNDDKGAELKIVGSARDITYKKEAEIELVKANQDADLANKLKSTFLSQMSHEIRTPVNSIVSLSSLVEEEFEGNKDEDIEMCFKLIRKSGSRIIRTTDLILNLSEIQSGTYNIRNENLNLVEDVLGKLINEYSILAKEKEIKLILKNEIKKSIVSADSFTVEQIFSQLIDNALKYSDKGEVVIKVFENNKNKTTVEIIDRGVGISEEYLTKLFTPFSQEDMGHTRNYEGNGIGLALVKEYCNLNNLEIEVNSEKGVGTKVSVTFQS